MSQNLDRTAELINDDELGTVTMSVKRILVPTDGSATAVEATQAAIALAKCFGSEVVALFVEPGRIEDPMQYLEQEQLEGVKHSDAGLRVARALGQQNGVQVTTLTAEGAVGHQIIEAARDSEVGLIVMGTEGRTGFRRAVLGSVADSVIREAHVPVMVVRHCSTEFCMQPRG